MVTRNRPVRRPPLAAEHVAVAVLLLGAACAPGEPETAAEEATEVEAAEPAVDVYEAHGVVVALPDPTDDPPVLTLDHETIDTFRSASGEVVGMEAMTMSFPIAAGVDVAQLEVGDPVAFTLEVDWSRLPIGRIVAVRPLPPDTELELATPDE